MALRNHVLSRAHIMQISILSALPVAAALLGIPSPAAAAPLDGCSVTQEAGVFFYQCLNRSYARSPELSTCAGGNTSQLAYDLYVPTTFDSQTQIKFPLVIAIHGGGWGGDRSLAVNEARQFAALGHVVVNIEYRTACSGGAPNRQMSADVQQFIDSALTGSFLTDYKIDANKVTLTGASAGAHLALMAATRGNRSYRNVVVTASPTELDELFLESDVFAPSKQLVTDLFVTTDEMRRQSPLYAVAGLRTDSLYMEHNQNDHVVPYRHTTDFISAAQARSIPTFLTSYNLAPGTPSCPDGTGHCAPPIVPDPVRGWCGDLTSGRVGFINRNGGTLSTALASQELPGWSACALIDGDINTSYSSASADRFNSLGLALGAWFNVRRTSAQTTDDVVTVSQVILRARMGGSPVRPLGFPVSYELSVTDPTNVSWISLGVFTAQPNAAGEVVINFPARQTHGMMLVPREMGTDDFGNYYLQMADLHMQ